GRCGLVGGFSSPGLRWNGSCGVTALLKKQTARRRQPEPGGVARSVTAMTSAVARISLRDAAVEYSRRGWSVIPLRPREKRPDIRSWAKYQQQAASVEQVQRYWERHPDANIGIVTGAVSGLVVLDVDGDAGRESLRD